MRGSEGEREGGRTSGCRGLGEGEKDAGSAWTCRARARGAEERGRTEFDAVGSAQICTRVRCQLTFVDLKNGEGRTTLRQAAEERTRGERQDQRKLSLRPRMNEDLLDLSHVEARDLLEILLLVRDLLPRGSLRTTRTGRAGGGRVSLNSVVRPSSFSATPAVRSRR